MSIQQIISILVNSGIEQNEANIEVKMLIEHFCNYGVKDILLGKKLTEDNLKIVREKAEYRAKTKMPIQYIIGQAYFMNRLYKVNKNVLIPRDETELVVSCAIELIKKNNYNKVLDIGTGSGCIAKDTNTFVDAIDISNEALKIAKENADILKIENIEFIQSDIYENLENKKYDLIISNPPYIPKSTKLQQEVMFEPQLALYAGGDNGTEFYKKIITDASKYLNKGGSIIFEIGINQDIIVKNLLELNGFGNIQTVCFA